VVKEDEAANGEGDAGDEDGPRRGAKPSTPAKAAPHAKGRATQKKQK
jgi:hypothetical protein